MAKRGSLIGTWAKVVLPCRPCPDEVAGYNSKAISELNEVAAMYKSQNEISISQVVKQKRQEIIELAAKHGVSNVRIFGSVARGDADEKSDVDLLVSLAPKFSLPDHVRLEEALKQLLGRKVDVISDRSLSRPRFKQRVLRDARPL